MPIAKMPGAEHIEFSEEQGGRQRPRDTRARRIANFKNRNPDKLCIPPHSTAAVAGFSAEAIIAALSKVNAEDPLKPLVDNIAAGNIRGICLFAGCNNVKVTAGPQLH